MKRVLVFLGCVVCPLVVIAQATALVFLAECGALDAVAEAASVLLMGVSPIGVVWVAGVYAIVHVVKRRGPAGWGKAAWIFAILFGYVFVLPIYWALYLREGPRRACLDRVGGG